MGKGGSKKSTVGYSYNMAGIFGLCLKATKLLRLVYGERVAWRGEIAAQGGDLTVRAGTYTTAYGGQLVLLASGHWTYSITHEQLDVASRYIATGFYGSANGTSMADTYTLYVNGSAGAVPIVWRNPITIRDVPDGTDSDGYTLYSRAYEYASSGYLNPYEAVGFDVNARDLYGGDSTGGSGGLQGRFYFNGGSSTQPPDAVMTKYLGADCPAFRGLMTLSMDSSYVASFSPTFRPLYCLVQNLGYDWYMAKQTIADTQINPAHEIRDALINPDLSGQYDVSELDDASFRAAADTLYAENFGLSPKWTDSGKAQEYIQSLLTHIDGVLVRDRATGKIKLKLLRGGYVAAELPTIGESQFTEITSLGTVSATAMVNKLTIKYVRITDVGEETATLTGENLANIAMQGGFVNATEIEFRHLTDAIADLPGRILARELRARSYPLRSFVLKGVHSLSSLQEGDLFVLNAPGLGISSLVCRILEADYGTLDDHEVTLTCAEDLYGITSVSMSTPTASEWSSPFSAPTVPSAYMAREMPLYLATKLSPLSTEADWTTGYPLAGFVMTLAKKNLSIDQGYRHMVSVNGEWVDYGTGVFTEFLRISAPMTKTATVVYVLDTTAYALKAGNFAFIEDEIVRIDSWTAHSVTVTRGVMDTLPATHPADTRCWVPGSTQGGVCTRQYTSGQIAYVVLQTYNSLGAVTPTTASQLSVTLRARAYRPYPPGGLSINGSYLTEKIEGALTVSWKHRDRLEQIDSVVAQTAANIGPETGTTYTVKVYDMSGASPVLKKTVTGLTGTSWTWDTEETDAGALLENLRVELFSVRDGYDSFQHWRHDFTRVQVGFGNDFGNNFGGGA